MELTWHWGGCGQPEIIVSNGGKKYPDEKDSCSPPYLCGVQQMFCLVSCHRVRSLLSGVDGRGGAADKRLVRSLRQASLPVQWPLLKAKANGEQ